MDNAMHTTTGLSRFAPPPRFNLDAHAHAAPRFSSRNESRISEQYRYPGHFAMTHPMLQSPHNLDEDLSQIRDNIKHYGVSESEDDSRLGSSRGGSTIGYTPATTMEQEGSTFENDFTSTTDTRYSVDNAMRPGLPPLGSHEDPAYVQRGPFPYPNPWLADMLADNSSLPPVQPLPRAGGRTDYYKPGIKEATRHHLQGIPSPMPKQPSRDDVDFLHGYIDSHTVTAQDRSIAHDILYRMRTEVPENDRNSIVDRLSKLLDRFEAVSNSSISANTDLVTTLTKRMESLEKSIVPETIVILRTRLDNLEVSVADLEDQGSISRKSADCGVTATRDSGQGQQFIPGQPYTSSPGAQYRNLQSTPSLRPIKNRNAIKITDAYGNPVEFGTEKKA